MVMPKRCVLIARAVLVVVSLAGLASMAAAQPETREVTLKLGGQSCDAYVVKVESALLRLRGVAMVDIEAKKGHVVVGYDSSMVSLPQILQTVARQRGEGWFCTAQAVSG
jgi:copper chaperone CopZ